MGELNPEAWNAFGLTHKGNIRDHNEDAFLSLTEQKLWAVADGMGGHSAGDVASSTIVECLSKYKHTPFLGKNIRQICNILTNANKRLLQKAHALNDVIGSTVVILIAHNRYSAVIWAGDSRLYRYRDAKLKQITRDHSESERLVDEGYPIEDINKYEYADAVTRAVGAEADLALETRIFENRENDRYLLCSDGLNKELSNSDIEQIILEGPPEVTVTKLLDTTLERGARDNTTLVVIETLDLD